MTVHYRHFRDRCHGGRTPQYTNLIAPLSSAVLRQASSLCSLEQLNRRQVLADILMNANRELASMPYDTPKKSFDEGHLAELVDASDAIRSASTGGQVFAGEAMAQASGNFTKEKAILLLRDDFLTHYEAVGKTGFFPRRYLEGARAIVEEAAQNGRFSHPANACPVSHVILAGELSNLSHKGLQGPSSWQALKDVLFRRFH